MVSSHVSPLTFAGSWEAPTCRQIHAMEHGHLRTDSWEAFLAGAAFRPQLTQKAGRSALLSRELRSW